MKKGLAFREQGIPVEGIAEKADALRSFSIFDSLAAGRIAEVADFFRGILSRKDNGAKKIPNIEIEIYFGSHATAQDVKDWQHKITDADVVIHEIFGATDKDREVLQSISYGHIKPKDIYSDASYNEYSEELTQALYNSGKKVEIIDLPFTHSLYKKIMREYKNERTLYSTIFSIPYKKYQAQLLQHITEIGRLMRLREAYIVKRFGEVVKRHSDTHHTSKPLRFFMFFGAVHTGIYHHLKGSGYSVHRSMGEKADYLYGSRSELTRKELFYKKITIHDITREIFSVIIRTAYLKIIDERFGFALNDQVMAFIRLTTQRFSDSDIEYLYNTIRAEMNSLEIGDISYDECEKIAYQLIKNIVDRALAKKSISFPVSKAELMAKLENKGIKRPLT